MGGRALHALIFLMFSSQLIPEALVEDLKEANCLRDQCYRGRFAPSPTGPLHLGNLRTALFSWLKARSENGIWLLRIDDLDTPRNKSGAIELIEKDLKWLGLNWDGPLIFQSQRVGLYELLLSSLKRFGKLYPCRCSRKQLRQINRPLKDQIYPGTCRNLDLPWNSFHGRLPSFRLRVGDEFAKSSGDIVLRRADGFIAYHFATAVDELFFGINEVVRGKDLEHAMYAQLAVLNALGGKPVQFKHVPVWYNKYGKKLSKRDGVNGLKNLQDLGFQAPKIIGLLAESLQLVPKGAELTAMELLDVSKKNKKLINLILDK